MGAARSALEFGAVRAEPAAVLEHGLPVVVHGLRMLHLLPQPGAG